MLDEIPEDTFRATDRIKRSSKGMEKRQLWKGLAMVFIVFLILFLCNKAINMIGSSLWPETGVNLDEPKIVKVSKENELAQNESKNDQNSHAKSSTNNIDQALKSITKKSNKMEKNEALNTDSKKSNSDLKNEAALKNEAVKLSRENNKVEAPIIHSKNEKEIASQNISTSQNREKIAASPKTKTEDLVYYQEKISTLELELTEQKEKIKQLEQILLKKDSNIKQEKIDAGEKTFHSTAKNEVSKGNKEINLASFSKIEQKILSMDANHYAIQIYSSESKTKTENFLKQIKANSKVYYYQTTRNTKPWYVLIYGDFHDFASANRALKIIPKELQAHSPWVRRYRGIQESIRDKT